MKVVQLFYVATERFDPRSPGWVAYCEWAKFSGLEEVVSLDLMLCPSIYPFASNEQDWNHFIEIGGRPEFSDLDYLLQRVQGKHPKNILAAYRNQDRMVGSVPNPEMFEFIGFDLLEDMTCVSALLNCGGFPESFSNEELNRFGLLPTYERAAQVRLDLRMNNPNEPHAECELYELWRLREEEQPADQTKGLSKIFSADGRSTGVDVLVPVFNVDPRRPKQKFTTKRPFCGTILAW